MLKQADQVERPLDLVIKQRGRPISKFAEWDVAVSKFSKVKKKQRIYSPYTHETLKRKLASYVSQFGYLPSTDAFRFKFKQSHLVNSMGKLGGVDYWRSQFRQ